MKQYQQTLAEVLMASYLYYYRDVNVLSDAEYDTKCMYLRKIGQQPLNNELDKLIDWEAFKTSTSLSYIVSYPRGLIRIAEKWLELVDK